MVIFTLDAAPSAIRGELTRWFLELKPGVFVGNVNKRIRELLWERICKTVNVRGAVMVFSTNNEQGFELEIYGSPGRTVIDLDGIQLIKVTK